MSRRRKRPSQLDIDKFLFSQGIPKFELYRPPPKRRYRRKSAATSSQQPSTSTQTPPSLPSETVDLPSTQRIVTSKSSTEPANITTDGKSKILDPAFDETLLNSASNVDKRSSTSLHTMDNHSTEVPETLEVQRDGDGNA